MVGHPLMYHTMADLLHAEFYCAVLIHSDYIDRMSSWIMSKSVEIFPAEKSTVS